MMRRLRARGWYEIYFVLVFSLVFISAQVHELKTAQEAGIPIIVVIDNEHYNQRGLIDMYSKLGFSFLFGEQVIGHSAEYRKAAYEKIRDAVVNAIVTTDMTKTKAAAHNVEPTAEQTSGDAMPSFDEQFRLLVFKIFPSVEVAWGAFDSISEPRGQLSRADFKAVLKMLHLTISSKEKGASVAIKSPLPLSFFSADASFKYIQES